MKKEIMLIVYLIMEISINIFLVFGNITSLYLDSLFGFNWTTKRQDHDSLYLEPKADRL